MEISIFGLGYVGVVSAACLGKNGHTVIGVDPVSVKVEMINKGESPIIEKEIGELIATAVEQGKLKAFTSAHEAI
ncbi:MAG: GDP-mannose dehydrogenase, partial [Desulfamplus sp.]|nr:GDP-mannose dehydrogenase [Desulfamplus sp.]